MNNFEALAVLASKEQWCWKLQCTTCGHMHFRYAFLELANGKSPEDKNWIIHGNKTDYKDELGPLPRRYTFPQKETVLSLCSSASLRTISDNCISPDWLGYLGLVLEHMRLETDPYKNLSTIWADQLKGMVASESEIGKRLIEVASDGNSLLGLQDLERIEASFET